MSQYSNEITELILMTSHLSRNLSIFYNFEKRTKFLKYDCVFAFILLDLLDRQKQAFQCQREHTSFQNVT